jgi:hypothetical protein
VIRPSHSIGPENGLMFFACLSVNGMSVEFHVSRCLKTEYVNNLLRSIETNPAPCMH